MIRTMLFAAFAAFNFPAAAQEDLAQILTTAEQLEPLETVIVAQHGEILAERGYRGHSVTDPTNIKSASKTILATLVGIAIERGVLEGVDQPIATILDSELPDDFDPRLERVTLGNLLSMQAGLQPTSGPNYGRWIASRNWVRAALDQPFADEPGGRMLYSTGSSHLVSAALTEATGETTLALARDWLGAIEGFSIAGWERDPQGIYLGGNEMAMSPRSLLAFGEMIQRGGVTADGERIVPQGWIEQSWVQRTTSRFNSDGYGYGWFLTRIADEDVRYAWGYGGQMLYLVPALELTVVMTSDASLPAASTGHRDDLKALLAQIIAAVRPAPAATP
jgi:CubicO group peptidase (beta-lactamase class C family)